MRQSTTLLGLVASLMAYSLTAGGAAAVDAVRFDPDGTAHIQALRVPIPATLSAEGAEWLKQRSLAPDPTEGFSLPPQQLRPIIDKHNQQLSEAMLKRWPADVKPGEMGGVPVRVVTPTEGAEDPDGRILVNFHAGAFMLGAGSIVEAVPMAGLTGLPVVAVDYRLAPENPFPAAVDDAVAVYRELLKSHPADKIALYGSSAGAGLTAQVTVRLKQLGLPMPAALGFFSGTADASRPGDSEAFFSFAGLAPVVVPSSEQAQGFVGKADLRDPVLSPVFSDLTNFPPTLCMTGTRDFFLSSTTMFHRALLQAGVDAQLVVFDGMPHIHWENFEFPEALEALELQAAFLKENLAD